MKRVVSLMNRAKYSFENEGLEVFGKKTKAYLRRHIRREKVTGDIPPDKAFMDVLFVNGCYLPHPSRYRVSHQREQLLAANMITNEVFYDKLTLDMLKNYRMFIFFRCPYTDTIGEFIKRAKAMNKTVLFDIDDLVIDTKYTEQIKYLKTMSKEDKAQYDDGVRRMQQTLRLCDAAITTTERLADELKGYVPDVFINRNTASERMVELSMKAVYERDVLPFVNGNSLKKHKEKKAHEESRKIAEARKQHGVKLGYFSGSITHNDDFLMILPIVARLMKEYKTLELHIVGELDVPEELAPFKERIITTPFISWEKLPSLIASVDINLVPLEQSIFNEAKSENKWVEASLVKVITVASAVGAFEKMVVHNETGMLCEDNENWYATLKNLIENKEIRKTIAENAYRHVLKKCTTVYTSQPLYNYIKSKMTPNIAFVLPSLQISGGVLVTVKHCLMLRKAGYDVLIINEDTSETIDVKEGAEIPAISRHKVQIWGSFDKAVATLWSTLSFLEIYSRIRDRYYFVQNFETDFYESGKYFKIAANQTYNASFSVKYITISRWCQNWLRERYGKESGYAPNGLDLERFTPKKRKFDGKIRILVEGNSDDYYKNVDESFKIIDKLDKNKFEIWFMSYQGKPKPYYHVDKFLHKVPYEKVPQVYHKCHILIKSSILESFSYPPLEMMATGGFVVVAPNEGNVEYLRDGENCLFYQPGNIENAVEAIEKICSDQELRESLYIKGIETARSRGWDSIEKDILELYDVKS